MQNLDVVGWLLCAFSSTKSHGEALPFDEDRVHLMSDVESEARERSATNES